MFIFIIFDRLKSTNFKDIMDNIKDVEELKQLKKEFDAEISKVIVGQNEIVNQMFIALLCNGHILLEGVPGLAKTLMIKSIMMLIDISKINIKHYQ